MHITALRNAHSGETVTIVGKGPSLLRVQAQQVGTGPIIALNDALLTVRDWATVGPVYSMQKDGAILPPIAPERLIVHVHESAHAWPDYPARYEFDNPRDFGLRWDMPSVVSATKIAELMGAQALRFVAMDAVTTGDTRLVFDGHTAGSLMPPDPIYGLIADMLREALRAIGICSIEWVTA